MKTHCPHCNYLATNHETLDNLNTPSEGDISFCINCGELSQFKESKLIKADFENLDVELKQEIEQIQSAWIQKGIRAQLQSKDKEKRK